MPDPVLFLKAGAVSAIVAAVLALLFGRPWAAPHPIRTQVGYVLGVGLGFYVGCWVLGITVAWPLPSRQQAQDLDRLLLVVIPAVIFGELLASATGKPRLIAWPVRAAVVAGTVRVLLDRSIYITDIAGPTTREWTANEALWVFVVTAGALAVAWGALGKLSLCSQGRSVPLVLAVACAGVALCVMLSGYARGGQVGIPLAGSLAGVSLASFFLKNPAAPTGVVSVGTVGLFAVLVIGRFYGSLTTLNALLLFFGPVGCWLMEIPSRFAGMARVAIVSGVVTIALVLAGQKFAEDSAPKKPATPDPSSGSPEVSAEDYLNYGT